MRAVPVAVVAIVAAVVGSLGTLVVAKTTGAFDGRRVETIVLRSQQPASPARRTVTRPPASPLVGNRFDPRRIYALRSPGVVTIFASFEGEFAQGSGFVVSSRGHILTNSHVITNAGEGEPGSDVEAADRLYVEFPDGDRVPAKIVGWDVFDDVGLIRVDPRDHRLTPVPLGDSDEVVVGEPVAAIGSPFGNENSLSVGVVSATHRSISSLTSSYAVADAIQTDAAINHGNSGGPLLDARGRVIGINAQIRSGSGRGEGVGFAIPINWARRSMEQLLRSGGVSYAYVGIRAGDLTPSLARHLGYGTRRAALVECVEPGSSGADSGLRGGREEKQFNGVTYREGGDLVVAIDGMPVRSGDDLVRIVSQRLRAGQVAAFTVLRDGRTHVIPVKLGKRPEEPGESHCD